MTLADLDGALPAPVDFETVQERHAASAGRNLLPCDGTIVLYPDFLPEAVATELVRSLTANLAWQQEHLTIYGRRVACPRLTAWYGDPGLAYTYAGIPHVASGWPPALATLRAALARLGVTTNSVLCNLYRSGRDHMGWHSDAEPELGPDPDIASISLGACRRFLLRHRSLGHRLAVDLPHGSLLRMHGSTQHFWQHRLAPTARPVAPRINLTFRRIRQP